MTSNLRLVLVAIVLHACTPKKADEKTPIQSSVDVGFDVAQNGLSFPDFTGRFEQVALTPALVEQMLGRDACAAATGACRLLPSSKMWMDNVNDAMSSGHSEGLAVLAQLFFLGVLDPKDYGADTVHGLTLAGNTKLQQAIAVAFASQALPSVVVPQTKRLLPADLLAFVTENFFAHESPANMQEYYRLGIYQKTDGVVVASRALTVIGLDRGETDAVFSLRVYDSSFPGEVRKVDIDALANTWTYQAGDARFEGGVSNPLYFAPVKARMQTQACAFCKGETKLTVVSPALETLLSNGGADILGGTAGEDSTAENILALRVFSVDRGFQFYETRMTAGREELTAQQKFELLRAQAQAANKPVVSAGSSTRALAQKLERLAASTAQDSKVTATVSGNGSTTMTGEGTLTIESTALLSDENFTQVASKVEMQFQDNTEVRVSTNGEDLDVSVKNPPPGSPGVQISVTKTSATGEEKQTTVTVPVSATETTSVSATTASWTEDNPFTATVTQGTQPPYTVATCGSGYDKIGGVCVDINECLTDNGGCGDPETQLCTNLPGRAPTCSQITNPCLANNGGCNVNATCTLNQQGKAVCTCNAPYWTGDGKYCGDVFECATNNGGCDANATCFEYTGAAPTCMCKEFWTGNGITCEDVDECETNNGECPDVCENNIGAAPTCSGENNCPFNNPCGENLSHGICVSQPVGYTCTCNAGYAGADCSKIVITTNGGTPDTGGDGAFAIRTTRFKVNKAGTLDTIVITGIPESSTSVSIWFGSIEVDNLTESTTSSNITKVGDATKANGKWTLTGMNKALTDQHLGYYALGVYSRLAANGDPSPEDWALRDISEANTLTTNGFTLSDMWSYEYWTEFEAPEVLDQTPGIPAETRARVPNMELLIGP